MKSCKYFFRRLTFAMFLSYFLILLSIMIGFYHNCSVFDIAFSKEATVHDVIIEDMIENSNTDEIVLTVLDGDMQRTLKIENHTLNYKKGDNILLYWVDNDTEDVRLSILSNKDILIWCVYSIFLFLSILSFVYLISRTKRAVGIVDGFMLIDGEYYYHITFETHHQDTISAFLYDYPFLCTTFERENIQRNLPTYVPVTYVKNHPMTFITSEQLIINKTV